MSTNIRQRGGTTPQDRSFRSATGPTKVGSLLLEFVHGETDNFSYNLVDKPVHVNDLNAIILKCMGIDHERLTYKFQGLDQRLTGVEPAKPVLDVLL